jgi:hypothetical protein
MIKTTMLYANYTKKNKLTMTIAMVVMAAAAAAAVVVVGMATIPASISSNNAFALDTLCPPGHQCHCIIATGVYYDFDPETARVFSNNTGCVDDNR